MSKNRCYLKISDRVRPTARALRTGRDFGHLPVDATSNTPATERDHNHRNQSDNDTRRWFHLTVLHRNSLFSASTVIALTCPSANVVVTQLIVMTGPDVSVTQAIERHGTRPLRRRIDTVITDLGSVRRQSSTAEVNTKCFPPASPSRQEPFREAATARNIRREIRARAALAPGER